ncbi:MAG: hypothetical protein L3J52_09350 [Proteobacteria bacterium]|nr:hypothetical protein [Pseudomonadota bacterium]
MKKVIFILSTHRLSRKTAALFRSYCHLLKPKLNSQWVVNSLDEISDVVVVDAEDDDLLQTNVNAKISLVKHNAKTVEYPKKVGKTHVFRLDCPINSFGMATVLNKISSISVISKNSKKPNRHNVSIRNSFSRLMSKTGFKNIFKTKKTKIIVSKLMDSCESNIHQSLKVVFIGRPGAGKTTAIANASTSKVLTTEVNTTDSVGLLKTQTTIGIDYGEYLLKDKVKLRLYGTPGQARYDFIRNQIIKNADIYVILVDLTSSRPLKELKYYINLTNHVGNEDALKVVAFTHCDSVRVNTTELIGVLKGRTPGFVLFVALDAREGLEVEKILQEATDLFLGNNDASKSNKNVSTAVIQQAAKQ